MEENKLIKERKRKLKELQDKGINPFAYEFDRKHHAKNIKEDFQKFDQKKVSVAGRIMTVRSMGKVTFMHLQDSTDRIQLYFKSDQLEDYSILKLFDIGDIIGVNGNVFKTKKGEITVEVKDFKLLTKSMRPLPDKWHGLKDQELRYRQRYLDLIMTPSIKEVFMARDTVINAIREYLLERNYVEVQTPILQPIYGGASARPFVSKLNALNMPVYMRISNELYLKRLIVGGFDRVFEFSIDFRNEGIDRSHNPEFVLFEAMTAYSDYKDGMILVEKLTEYAVKKIKGTTKINYQGKVIDFKTPWTKISVKDAIQKYASINIEKTDDTELKRILEKNNIKLKGEYKRGNAIMALIEEFCEKHFVQPTILYDYPFETSPLSKPKRDDPRYAERFEQYTNCFELGNNYTELNNPIILRKNWTGQEEALEKGDEDAQRMDWDFINALEVGMPPTCGIAIGIDRLVMLLTDQHSIRDVILFPFMKPIKHRDQQREPVRNESLPDDKVIISSGVQELGLKTAYAIIKGVKVEKSNSKLKALKKDLTANPNTERIKSMQMAYKSFGVDPSKRLPSAEALIKRVEQGKGVYNVNTIVDSYNLSSIKESLPMAAYDLHKVDFPINLRFADEGEEITLIGGQNKSISKGEVVYADMSRVLCLDFNYRDCDYTKITPKTKDIIVFVDGCRGIEDKEQFEALENTCKLIIEHCGGEVIEKRITGIVQNLNNINLKQTISRQQAVELVKKYNTNKTDWNHFLESEALMRALARKLGEDEETWGLLGLVHDVDWGITKNNSKDHLTKAPEILREAGFTQDFINVILSHGYGFDCAGLSDKKRTGKIEHALASAETITGLIHAYALMRGGSVSDMKVKGLKKKFKDKSFAAKINRNIVMECEKFGLSLADFLQLSIDAIKSIAKDVGLN